MLPLPDLRGSIAMSHTSPPRALRCPCGWIQRSMYIERTVSSRLPLAAEDDRTEVGSYFVATYPPFSVWTAAAVEGTPGRRCSRSRRSPLGMYLHIPFCRKRCHFCYRVHRQERAGGGGVSRCARAGMGALRGTARHRRPSAEFRVIGGGTPSFLSTQQLEGLVARLSAVAPWRDARRSRSSANPHVDEGQAGNHPADRRDEAEPRHRKLRRPNPRAQRSRAPIA